MDSRRKIRQDGGRWKNFNQANRQMSRYLLTLILLAGLASGCATDNGPRTGVRPGLGFVDFRPDPPDDLAWRVSQFNPGKQAWQQVYSDLKPPANGVLRLVCPPGPYQFQVTFLNRVVLQPALVQVEVVDGLITPVTIALIPNGTVTVDQKQALRLGSTVKGTQGQRSKYNGDESTAYRLEATVRAPTTLYPLPPTPSH